MLKRAIGLDAKAFDEARNRLAEAGLINEEWQPINWNKRQFVSDHDPTAAERKRKQRDRERHGNVTRESRPSESDTDTESDKNVDPLPLRSKSIRQSSSLSPKSPDGLKTVSRDKSGPAHVADILANIGVSP